MAKTNTIDADAMSEPQADRPIDWERERVDYTRAFCNMAETWRICSKPRCRRHQTCLEALPCSAILALPRLTRDQEGEAMADFHHFIREHLGDYLDADALTAAEGQVEENNKPRPARAKRSDLKDYYRTVRTVLARLWWPPRSAAERGEPA